MLLFVGGTDTGIGKTLVTALLGLHFQAQNRRVAVLKPFASGCEVIEGELRSEDAEFLSSVLQTECICPIRLEEPLAPLVAARRAGISTRDWFEKSVEAIETARQNSDVVLVEGVGGLLVPVGEDQTGVWSCERLISHFEMPVVLVARRTLGTINHSLLSLSRPAIRFCGLVFNDANLVEAHDVAAQTSPALISELSGIPIWGEVPFSPDLSRVALEQHAAPLHVRVSHTGKDA